MNGPLRLASRIFLVAGLYGLIVLLPLCFAESAPAQFALAGMTRPEYFYGFLGQALVMQLIYLTIARNPQRFRPLIPLAVLAKLGFGIAVGLLWLDGRVQWPVLVFGLIDLALAMAFALCWTFTPPRQQFPN